MKIATVFAARRLFPRGEITERKARSAKLFYAAMALVISLLLSWEHIEGAPTRAELVTVKGPIVSAEWRGVRHQRLLLRVADSPLLFQPRLALLRDRIPDVAAVLKPGTAITIGHWNHPASYLDGSTDIALLMIGDQEYYGPEIIADRIRRDRLPSFLAIACLLSIAAYLLSPLSRKPTNP